MWGTDVEIEIRNRILVSVYAYAYEFLDTPLVTDYQWDTLAKKIRPNIKTGNPVTDNFFKYRFENFSGQWIHEHPNLPRLSEIATKLCEEKNNEFTGIECEL